ncbi:unnamed protein product [Lota lota]
MSIKHYSRAQYFKCTGEKWFVYRNRKKTVLGFCQVRSFGSRSSGCRKPFNTTRVPRSTYRRSLAAKPRIEGRRVAKPSPVLDGEE